MRGTPGRRRRVPDARRRRRAPPARAGASWSLQPDTRAGRDQWIDGEATDRPRRRLRDHPPGRHVRVAGARARRRTRRPAVRRGPRLDQRHVRQRQADRARPRASARATACRSANRARGGTRGEDCSAGAFSDAGRVRDNNEDAYVVDERLALFAVADGMGGHVARRDRVVDRDRGAARRGRERARRSTTRSPLANDAVLEKAAGDPKLSGMGTTMTAVVVAGGSRLLIGHVGDSRAYFLHDGDARAAHRRPQPRRASSSARAGSRPSRPKRTRSARSSRARSASTRDVDVDLYTVDVAPGDRVVLCSDGLTDMVREREIERIAARRDGPATRRRAARRRGERRGRRRQHHGRRARRRRGRRRRRHRSRGAASSTTPRRSRRCRVSRPTCPRRPSASRSTPRGRRVRGVAARC